MDNFEALWAYQTEDIKADAIANAIRRSPVRQKLEKTRDLILDRQKQYKQIEVEITAMADRKDIIEQAVAHSETQLQALKEKFEEAVTIFILPPSYEELESRLKGRGTETEDVIARRLAEAKGEILRANEFDYVVVNDDVDKAAAKIEAIIEAERCRYERNKGIEKSSSWT